MTVTFAFILPSRRRIARLRSVRKIGTGSVWPWVISKVEEPKETRLAFLPDFTLPADEFGKSWLPVLNTAEMTEPDDEPQPVAAGATVRVEARAMAVLRAEPAD